jgi:predicted GIY-YIG superfamily endonuclease
MANKPRTLYTGVTNNLEQRVDEHKHRMGSRFTSTCSIDRLV